MQGVAGETLPGRAAMNAIMDNILTRRSVRSFVSGKKISQDVLRDIVTAGMFAPTALNRQPVLFTVVTDKEKIQRFAKAVGKAAGKGDGYNFYDPEAIVITSCDRESRFVKEDTSCALENMFLYAHSVGVGSVWINQPLTVCDDKAVREILSSFGIPESHVLGGMAALGYPAEMPEKDLTRKCKMNFVD